MPSTGVGLLGAGRAARAHLPALAGVAEARVVGLYDIDEEAARRVSAEHGVARIFRSHSELLDCPDVEVVAVLLPHDVHARYAIEALTAGRHVVVEKPLAISLAEADAMLDAAAKAGRRLFAVQNRIYDPAIELAHDLLTSGAIGDVFLARTTGYESDAAHVTRPWLRDDRYGVLMAQSVHEAYLLRWLVGEVARVSCFFSTKRPVSILGQHTAVVALEFVGGAIGEMSATFGAVHGPGEHSLSVFGDRGYVEVTDRARTGRTLRWRRPRSGAYRVRAISQIRFGDSALHEISPRDGNGLQRMWQDYIQAIRNGTAPRSTAEDGRKAIEIMLAAHRSAETGRVVGLPIDAG